MKLYLAGPMSDLPEFNYPEFFDKAARLRSAGHTVICPAENFASRTNLPLTTYLRRDYTDILACHGIALLHGYETSCGALKELILAVTAGIPVYDAEWLLEEKTFPLPLKEFGLAKLLVVALSRRSIAAVGRTA